MHRLAFLDPGHFHAALTLRSANPRIHPTVHVYAPLGPDLEAFLALVRGFNDRAEAPTNWDLQVHAGEDSLDRLIAERSGDCVVLACRNDRKIVALDRLHQAGFPVLADKPWVTGPAALDALTRITAAPPVAKDMITAPYDGLIRLRTLIAGTPSVFGTLTGSPAIAFDSVHHLVKQVSGKTLKRPPWYYDVRLQGDGIVDIHSHMVDQAQILIAPERIWDFDRDMVIDGARRWTTPVPLALYQDSTGEDAFPDALRDVIRDGVLALACNGEITYRLLGHAVHQRATWEPREPAGGGDTMQVTVRGSGATVIMRQGPESGGKPELHLQPSAQDAFDTRIRDALPAWRESFPGLEIESSALGFQLLPPARLLPGHEAHFAMLLDRFLDLVEGGPPPALAPANRARYTLLAKAQEMASQ